MNYAPEWTPRMDERLIRQWGQVSVHDLAAALGCTAGQLRHRAIRLGLTLTDEAAPGHDGDGPSASAQDERFVRAMTNAIRSRFEYAPIGIDTRPCTTKPVYVPHRKSEPLRVGPAASCAEAGD